MAALPAGPQTVPQNLSFKNVFASSENSKLELVEWKVQFCFPFFIYVLNEVTCFKEENFVLLTCVGSSI